MIILLFTLKIWGNLIGRITASYKVFFANSKPATSSHFTFGLSVTIASFKEFYSLSSSSSFIFLNLPSSLSFSSILLLLLLIFLLLLL
jgi:hypothetical protein